MVVLLVYGGIDIDGVVLILVDMIIGFGNIYVMVVK